MSAPGVVSHGENGPDIRDIFQQVRDRILDGTIHAGQTVSQKQLAEEFGISRAKLREAIRMLEADGLLVTQQNKRSRVPALSADAVDLLYAERILYEATAATITVANMTPDDLRALDASHDGMHAAWREGDMRAWDEHHKTFHRLLVRGCPAPMLATVEAKALHAERYRRFYLRRAESWPQPSSSAEEHKTILDLAHRGLADETARALGQHYLRYGLALAALVDPLYSPVAVLASARVVGVPARR
jgi:DNA-binding GntR family transcriptional regulator